MVDATLATTQKGMRFFLGLAILTIGYTTALIGFLTFFKIPLLLTCGMTVGGLLATTLGKVFDHALAFPPLNSRYRILTLFGSLPVAAIMVAFANSNWMSWYIHPAGFQGVWIVTAAAAFHFSAIRKYFVTQAYIGDIPMSDFDANQASNPYAPPMHVEDRTNNGMDTKGSIDGL